jgi:hypothetical protein
VSSRCLILSLLTSESSHFSISPTKFFNFFHPFSPFSPFYPFHQPLSTMSFWYSSDHDVVDLTTSSPPSAGHRAQLIMRQNPPPPPAWSARKAPGTRAPTAAARQRIIQQGQGVSTSPRQPVQLRASVTFWLYKLPRLGKKASLQNLGPNITTVITPDG